MFGDLIELAVLLGDIIYLWVKVDDFDDGDHIALHGTKIPPILVDWNLRYRCLLVRVAAGATLVLSILVLLENPDLAAFVSCRLPGRLDEVVQVDDRRCPDLCGLVYRCYPRIRLIQSWRCRLLIYKLQLRR